MASSSARPPTVENWDDDPDFASLPSSSSVFAQPIATAKSTISSRLSTRSDSNAGDDDWQLPVTPIEADIHCDAISSAKAAGIPIPQNTPSSALVGGAIKRLGGNKRKQIPDNLDDWAEDLDLPSGVAVPLQLKPRAPATSTLDEDFDTSWAEGSLGVRFAGTPREARNRSSNASAMSPSLGSILTVESDDDGLNGLVLPDGPLDLHQVLKRRRNDTSAADETSIHVTACPPSSLSPSCNAVTPGHEQDDDDFLYGLGLDQGESLDLRKRGVHDNVKTSQSAAKGAGTHSRAHSNSNFSERMSTRIPRPVSGIKTGGRLEPVLETGGAHHVTRPHRLEPTTTSAQLLRSKRSMPTIRNHSHVLNKAQSTPGLKPNQTSPQTSKNLISSSQRLSHIHSRRESDSMRPLSPTVRVHSRLSSIGTMPDTPTRHRTDLAPAMLAREAVTKRNVTRPTRRKNFGDGTELDSFDDLPTSATKESRFVKQPHARPPPSKYLRSQSSQGRLGMRDKMSTPQPPATSFVSNSQDHLPRFARDTAASRIAREQTIGQPSRAIREGPLAPRTNWAAQVAARSPYNSPQSKRTLRKVPTLINPMGKENTHHFQEDAVKMGMHWNATAGRWEGNEAAVANFGNARGLSPPRPALISNMAARQGVQVVGGMVFDPQRMCWLKMGGVTGNPASPMAEDEEDPFKDIEDLAERRSHVDGSSHAPAPEWLVGEEFDLGPAFIQRQRDEEMAWRVRMEKWFASEANESCRVPVVSIDDLRQLAQGVLAGMIP